MLSTTVLLPVFLSVASAGYLPAASYTAPAIGIPEYYGVAAVPPPPLLKAPAYPAYPVAKSLPVAYAAGPFYKAAPLAYAPAPAAYAVAQPPPFVPPPAYATSAAVAAYPAYGALSTYGAAYLR